MAESTYQQLHAMDEQTTEHEAPSLDEEAGCNSMSNDRIRSPDVQDRAGRHFRGSLSSEHPTHIPISPDEDHPSRRSDAPRNDTPLLNDNETDSSPSAGTTDGESRNGSQVPALDQSAQNLRPTWTEVYFRPLFLIVLALLLALIIVVLEILNSVSQHNQGLVTASEDMHYIWTYGPTFGNFGIRSAWLSLGHCADEYLVLTMMATLWGQLELRARQIMPWCLMSRGETTTQNGLMLNYVTSSTLGSLIRSLKRKHFLVSTGIGGSFVLRLMIVFASGLLRLEYRSLVVERPISVEDIIDLTLEYHEAQETVTTIFNYYAALKYGVPLPHGTTSQFAVQTFVDGDDGKSCPTTLKKKCTGIAL